MIIKQSRDGKTVATYESEEIAVKENKLSLALLRSHLNSKKPKYLDGFVYVVEKADAADMLTGDPLKDLTEEAKKEVVDVPMDKLKDVTFVQHKDFHMDIVKLPNQTLGDLAGLASTIDYKTPGPEAFDGPKLDKFTADEHGQWPAVGPISVALANGIVQIRPEDVPPNASFAEVIGGLNAHPGNAAALSTQTIETPEGVTGNELWKDVPDSGEPIQGGMKDGLYYSQYDGSKDLGRLPIDDEAPEPQPPGLNLRAIASRQLSDEPVDAELEDDFNLTPMQKRAKELKKRPPL